MKAWSVATNELYDFLYVNDYAAWFCNSVRLLSGQRGVREWIMKLHTGETQESATKGWTWEQRRKLGQQYLFELAEDILQWLEGVGDRWEKDEVRPSIAVLRRSLELDGYSYQEGRLRQLESDVLDVEQEGGVLAGLYRELNLGDSETAVHHLKLSEQHYLEGRWDDCIANSRKFLELVLSSSAAAYSERVCSAPLPPKVATSPVAVRDLLETEGLLETKEKEALSKVYGLLSHTGGHPYMAQNDQARLLRQLSLTFSQFVLLRLRGKLQGK